jgi:hypothetical protein
MTGDFNPTPQHEVLRQFGRCMLRLQQYERLLKSMPSLHRLVEAIDELAAQQATLINRFANNSLGQLVETLFETYIVPEGTAPPQLEDSKLPSDRITTSISFQMVMSEERLVEVKVTIEEMVRMRNELIHRFHRAIQRLDGRRM